ncbi:MAG: chemotaxis protein CheX [Lachnospiraceae bacterium]|nr:chemotaxis protein CheX [Lachnospiraceae bacterium]
MFTQFFGNFLLYQKLITPEQLLEAIRQKQETRMKLGVLAINAGYMTASQVERIHELQSKMDKRIGDIAVELGYITEEQLAELLNAQPLGYLLLGQAIIDKGFMTNSQFEAAIRSYKEKYSLSDEDISNNENSKSDTLIASLYDFSKTSNPSLYKGFVTLLMNNFVRFVGDDFTPLEPEFEIQSDSYKATFQKINGEFSVMTHIFAKEKELIQFACRYSGENITELDEYAEASGQDFINLHNGLFTVNASNNQQIELTLTPPAPLADLASEEVNGHLILPFQFPFGIIRFAISI